MLGISLKEPVCEWIAEQGVPLVTFATPWRCSVALETDAMIHLAVAELAQQGCRRLGLWKPFSPLDSAEANVILATEDEQVFREALDRHGLEFNPAFLQDGVAQLREGGKTVPPESNQEQGFRAVFETLGDNVAPRPDGLVIVDDLMTHGALAALSKLGLRPGYDVRIASHANQGSPILMGQDQLTLIYFDVERLVHEMFCLLEVLMTDRTWPTSPVLIPPELRPRSD